MFINAHLAINYANKVAIIASHTQCAEFLYPSSTNATNAPQGVASNGTDNDTEMTDADEISLESSSKSKLTLNGPKHPFSTTTNGHEAPSLPRSNTNPAHPADDANKYRPFRLIEEALLHALTNLLQSTPASALAQNPTTSVAGALTLALCYINKLTIQASSSSASHSGPSVNPANPSDMDLQNARAPALQSRILILSVSGDLANQYIPIMNCIFASQRLSIPIDIAKIAGDTVFLQQASDATKGTYIKLEDPRGLLQYLMMGFLPDQTSREFLISPTQVGVDFRAACFCHRRVVDIGFVCSICLSIFCSPPEDATCLTCGTHLSLGDYGGKPAVIPRKKKRRKNRIDEEGRASGPATPGPA